MLGGRGRPPLWSTHWAPQRSSWVSLLSSRASRPVRAWPLALSALRFWRYFEDMPNQALSQWTRHAPPASAGRRAGSKLHSDLHRLSKGHTRTQLSLAGLAPGGSHLCLFFEASNYHLRCRITVLATCRLVPGMDDQPAGHQVFPGPSRPEVGCPFSQLPHLDRAPILQTPADCPC